jgi:hypothetical protein
MIVIALDELGSMFRKNARKHIAAKGSMSKTI